MDRALARRATLRSALVFVLIPGGGSFGGCSRPQAPETSDAAPSVHAASEAPLLAVERAEDLRAARAVPAEAARSHDVSLRRAAARAYARILDADLAPLLAALDDEDETTAAWGAYGLGEACKGHEDVATPALAARLSSLGPRAAAAGVGLDPRQAALRALGRCAGDPAEATLRAWLARPDADPATLEAAALALGEASARRGTIALETAGALLDAAGRAPPVEVALFAFGRTDGAPGGDVASRLLVVARAALGRAGPGRPFALKALGRAGADAAPDLARVLSSPRDVSGPDRAEAARSLGRLQAAGQRALAGVLASLVPDAIDRLAGDDFAALRAAVDAVAADPPREALGALWSFAGLAAPADAPLSLRRRASQLRCAAATKLARAAWDSDVLRACDVADGVAGERGRLAALDRAELKGARRAAWEALARSSHTQVAEEAVEVIERHPELGDAGLAALAAALASTVPGLVGTAADVLHGHPERAFVLAASERRAALDPRSPPPTSSPAREIDPRVAGALRAALARPWAEDLVETRVSLVDAAVALGLDEGRAAAATACKDPSVTVRARAAKALASAGDRDAACPAPDAGAPLAPELEHLLAHPTRVAIETDAGQRLGLRFDPALAPVAATRFVALARAGFYTHVPVHRVVPAFVAQLGDPGGDGYGGSGQSLRCETSPVPFGPLDVGVALAGRDTGSSQVFVTLSRQPHLDGSYAWVGRADGDWAAVAEGDVVEKVSVEPSAPVR